MHPGRQLIRFVRNMCRDQAFAHPKPHELLFDGAPVECSQLLLNNPELRPYRDLTLWWKYFLNPDRKVFPNYHSDPDKPLPALQRVKHFQLKWEWDSGADAYKVVAAGRQIYCAPDPATPGPKGRKLAKHELPQHRYPSMANPAFFAKGVKTEDDVIYRPNLPTFADSSSAAGQVLGQRDSELLLSFLTVPYIRVPLVLTFFASEDRVHKLSSSKLRAVLDSVLFEPGKYLHLHLTGVEPVMVPTRYPHLLASTYGLLMNELHRSPATVLRSVLALLKGALALDTGSVCDVDAADFNPSVGIILYVVRLATRVDPRPRVFALLGEDLRARASARDSPSTTRRRKRWTTTPSTTPSTSARKRSKRRRRCTWPKETLRRRGLRAE